MNRIIFSDNGSLIDCTKEINNYHLGSKVINYTANQDAIYVGSRLPFNHFYVKVKEANAVSANMSIQYWSNGWKNIVELRDETNAFSESGFVTFTPDRQTSWVMEIESEDVTGLEGIQIYDMYWIKITFDATLTSSTELSWIGQIFCDDYDLGAEYPDLVKQQTYMAFQNGKTSWEEQAVKASEILAQDLMSKGIIDDKAQILNREDYRNAAVCKVAELIFNAFGDDYIDQRQRAREEYQLRLSKKIHRVDLNQNAVEDISERKNTSGWLSR